MMAKTYYPSILETLAVPIAVNFDISVSSETSNKYNKPTNKRQRGSKPTKDYTFFPFFFSFS